MSKPLIIIDLAPEEEGLVEDLHIAADNDDEVKVEVNGNTYFTKIDLVK